MQLVLQMLVAAAAGGHLRLSLLIDGRAEQLHFGLEDNATEVAESFGRKFRLQPHERRAVAGQVSQMQSLDPDRRSAMDTLLQSAVQQRQRLGSVRFPIAPGGRTLEVEVDAWHADHTDALLLDVCQQERIELGACDALGPTVRAAVQRIDTAAAAAAAASAAGAGGAAYERALAEERKAAQAARTRERTLASAAQRAHRALQAAQAAQVRDVLALGGQACWRDDERGFRFGRTDCDGAGPSFEPGGTVRVGARLRLEARRYAVHELSLERYLHHASRFEPFVISVPFAGPRSPGMPNWNMALLAALCGNRSVLLQRSVANSTAWGGIEPLRRVQLAQFVSALLGEAGSDAELASGYLHDVKLAALCPALLEPGAALNGASTGISIPALFSADYLQHVRGLADGLRNGWPSLFIGPRGSSTALHSDHADTASWMGLLSGRKRWAIVPPWEVPLLHQNFSEGTAVRFGADLMALADADAANRGNRTTSAELATLPSFYDIDMRGGDVLFVPAACPHQVQNRALSVSVAQNFVDAAGVHRFAARLEELATSAGHTGLTARYYADLAKECARFPGVPAARRAAAAARASAPPGAAEFGARSVSYAEFKAGSGAAWLLGSGLEGGDPIEAAQQAEQEPTSTEAISISLFAEPHPGRRP